MKTETGGRQTRDTKYSPYPPLLVGFFVTGAGAAALATACRRQTDTMLAKAMVLGLIVMAPDSGSPGCRRVQSR